MATAAEAIEKLEKKMDIYHEQVMSNKEGVAIIAKLSQRHDESLYGNGREGLCARYEKLETIVTEDRRKKTSKRAEIFAGVAIFIAVLAPLIVPFITKYVNAL